MKHTLLLIEDELDLIDLLTEEFRDRYLVERARSGVEALDIAAKISVDLILLDLNLPDKSGIELCREFRQSVYTKTTPIFVISGLGDLEIQLQCFENGADDFIEKPFHIPLLKARIASRLRTVTDEISGVIRCGNLELNKAAKMVTVASKNLPFSAVEFRLLSYLVENPFRVVPREEMLKNIWGGVEVTARTIDAHLVSVRKALAEFDHEIVSMYGEGYSLRKKSIAKR